MSEESMQNMEARIPSLAQIAVQRARRQALAISGKVTAISLTNEQARP